MLNLISCASDSSSRSLGDPHTPRVREIEVLCQIHRRGDYENMQFHSLISGFNTKNGI
jgi:hypothetical protein